MTVDEPFPMLMDMSSVVLGGALSEYITTIPDDPRLPHGMRGETGVLFEFQCVGLPRPLRVFMRADAFPAGTGDGMKETFDRLHTLEGMAALDAARHASDQANYLAGLSPGAPAVHCPGCGARLFLEVARRGGCLACYPTMPPGDAAEVGP